MIAPNAIDKTTTLRTEKYLISAEGMVTFCKKRRLFILFFAAAGATVSHSINQTMFPLQLRKKPGQTSDRAFELLQRPVF